MDIYKISICEYIEMNEKERKKRKRKLMDRRGRGGARWVL
jgi:hypothetical protein